METNNYIGVGSVDDTQKYTAGFDFSDENAGELDLSALDIEIAIAHIDQYENSDYALLRKDGLGTSDSSIVLGVNPYTTKNELIQQKCRDYLTEEELAVGDKPAVKKGRELEPLIIHKHSQLIGRRILKPVDMYKHKEYPHIRFNFDGVIDKVYHEDGSYQYIPDEIKTISKYGQKHWDKYKAVFTETRGWSDVPPDISKKAMTIEQKAAFYGVPPYYYTQLQQQIFGLNAPYGFLTIMFEASWEMLSYFIWRDNKTINQLIIEDTKTWNKIEELRPEGFDLGVEIKE